MEQEEKQTISLKLKITPYVMWLVRNHWLWVFLMIGVQYVSGQIMVGDLSWLPTVFSISTWLKIHQLNGKVIVLSMLLLVVVKGYLWLLRKGKIN